MHMCFYICIYDKQSFYVCFAVSYHFSRLSAFLLQNYTVPQGVLYLFDMCVRYGRRRVFRKHTHKREVIICTQEELRYGDVLYPSFYKINTHTLAKSQIKHSHCLCAYFNRLASVLIFTGISSLSSCGDPERLPELPAGDEQRLQRAALHLQQKLILREWLKENRLQAYYSRFITKLKIQSKSAADIIYTYFRLVSVEVASLEDVYWLEDSRASHVLGKDWLVWSQARQRLPTSKSLLESLKADLWSTVVKSSQHQDAWTWGGMLVVSVSVAGLVTLAAMTQPSLAPEARHSLLQYVTGKYLLPANCTVQWDWPDPHVVGGTMVFVVRFFQRNGHPYPICDTDQFFVEVTEGTRKVVTISELGSEMDPNEGNVAKVKFTVRTAGQYKISLLIGTSHIAGSPFFKTFTPGPMDARRSRLIRPASTVVCCAGAPTQLHIEPRDEFGNACLFEATVDPTHGYKIELFDLNNVPIVKLALTAIKLAYDKVNARVTVTTLFPEPMCLRACINFRGQRLPNGEFDIIVLSSKFWIAFFENLTFLQICSSKTQAVTTRWSIKILHHESTTFATKPSC